MKLERLRYLRENNGLMQTDLACLLHVTQRTYSNYENGDRHIPYELLIKLAMFYGTSTDYLLGITDEFNHYKNNTSFVCYKKEISLFSRQLEYNNEKYRFNQKLYEELS